MKITSTTRFRVRQPRLSEPWYIPEYKNWWWPFWLPAKECYTDFGKYSDGFYDLYSAFTYLKNLVKAEKEKRKEQKNIIYFSEMSEEDILNGNPGDYVCGFSQSCTVISTKIKKPGEEKVE